MRHLKSGSVTQTVWKTIEQDYGAVFKKYLMEICDLNEEQAVSKYMNHPPDVTISKYIAGLAYAFHKGKWSGGFGGKLGVKYQMPV